jgi:MerR family transcriptional regulator, copper efflux regulator
LIDDLEELYINESNERVQIIEKMLTYKISLENNHGDLVEDLNNYHNQINKSSDDLNGFKDVEPVSYEDPYETYLITQIKIVEILPPVIEEYIRKLNVGDDIDQVLESFELEVFHIKREIYSDLCEWENLLDHIPDERKSEITSNPKGHGDLILKEIIWIKKYKEKLLKSGM